MQIKAAGQPLVNVPALTGAGVPPVGGNTRPQEAVGHELPALARRASSTVQSARPPERTTLSKLLAATPHSDADSATPHPEAARVMSMVASRELVLHNRHEPANLRAATTLAASGLAMLRRLQVGAGG